MKLFSLTLILLLALNLQSLSQEMFGVGISGAYNSAVKTPGFEFRLQVPLTKGFTVSPLFNYNNGSIITEMNVGIQFQYFLIKNQTQKGYSRYENKRLNPSLYLLAAFNYNKWINYFPSENERAKPNSFLPLGGIGFSFGGKALRLFTEAKINPIWGENMLELGIMLHPFNISGKGSKELRCPSYK